MRKAIFNSLFLLLAVVSSVALRAQDNDKNEPKYKKTKSYSKSYSIGSTDKVNLSNQFGEMKITTWDKNEVKVDATIIGKSNDETRAQTILDRISITDGKENGAVFFKTKFADSKDNWDKGNKGEHRNEGMEINWVVYIPSTVTLDADHQFGKMIVPDLKGETSITCKFGDLTAGRLSNSKEVDVEFSQAKIEQVNGGNLNIKFSEGTVNKLSGDVKSDLEFSQVKLDLDNDTKGLNIHNSYSTVYLDVDRNFSASYDISTSHGSFSNKTDFPIKKQDDGDDNRYGPRFNEKYSGSSGGGSCKIKVDSSFGEVVLGHDLKVDLSEKKKSKPTKTI